MPLVYAGPPPDAARLSRIAREPSDPDRYRTRDGRPCPGVTGLLADMGLGVDLPAWLSRERLAHLAERGQSVHEFGALCCRGEASKALARRELLDPERRAEEAPFCRALVAWRADRMQLFADCGTQRQVEVRFAAEDARSRAAGGRVDLALGPVAAVRGSRLYLFDFKLYDVTPRQGSPAALQLAGYAWGLRKALGLGPACEVKRRIVSLRDDGTYREVRFEQWANQDDLTWRGALAGWYARFRPNGTGGQDHGRYNVGQ